MRAERYTDSVVILTALNLEYEAVRAHLTHAMTRKHPSGSIFEQAHLPGVPGSVFVAVTGDGNQRAAVLTDRAIAMFQPRAVLFVGVAGALHGDLNLGDIIVGTKVYGYHGGTDNEKFQARPRAFEAPHDLEQLARHVAMGGHWVEFLAAERRDDPPAVRFRPIASGEVVLNSSTSPLAHQLRDDYNDAAAIEMEGAGASYAGHLNVAVPVLVMRGISDKADGQKQGADRAGWQDTAAANVAAFAVALAANILESSGVSPTGSEGVTDPLSGTDIAGAMAYSGPVKLEVCRRLGDSWTELADLLRIRSDERRRCKHGDEARAIWDWLELRARLTALRPALLRLDRADLVEILDGDP
jgi:adenosylhomocysteine nucleosidase